MLFFFATSARTFYAKVASTGCTAGAGARITEDKKGHHVVKDAVLFCDECKDFLCQGCFDWLHSRGRRQNHRRTWVEMGMCAECQESIALFHCVQCSDLYCRDCFAEWQ